MERGRKGREGGQEMMERGGEVIKRVGRRKVKGEGYGGKKGRERMGR